MAATHGQKGPATPLLFPDAAERPAPDVGLFRVLRDDGTADPETDPHLAPERAVELYRWMLLLRTLDARCLRLQRQGRIAFYGASTGQEAATVGSASCLREDDWVFPALREGGAALLRGMPLSRWFAQLMGNAEDEQKGRQQPMHFSWRAANHVSLSSPIGTQVPQAVGCARAIQVRGGEQVVLGCLGDGATSSPDFHAAMTFAGVWRPPVVLFCQNNGWAISVPVTAQTAAPTIAVKARGYGIPGVRVDGNDLLAVVRVVRAAVDRARRGEGPTFVEAVTYRRQGHSSSDDPTRYRDPAEAAQWERRDPLDRMQRHLEVLRLWDAKADEAEVARLDEEIARVLREAEQAPPPALDTLVEDVTGYDRPDLRADLDAVRPSFIAGRTAQGSFPL